VNETSVVKPRHDTLPRGNEPKGGVTKKEWPAKRDRSQGKAELEIPFGLKGDCIEAPDAMSNKSRA
jgi:hypothetical protein